MGAREYIRTVASNAIYTNHKQRIRISATADLYNIYPITEGKEVTIGAASGATVTVSGSSGNIKMTSQFRVTQGSTLALEVRDISGTLYWVPVGGKAKNA